MAVDVPVEVSELTPERLGAALREGGMSGVEVSEVSSERIGEGVGFIGQLHRLSVSYSSAPDGAPTSLIAKMPTSDPGGRFIGSMMRLYEKESGFYNSLVDQCPTRTARCFYNGADPEPGNWCLLLEDLADLVPGDQLIPRSHDEILGELELLARIHAAWGDGRADAHPWLPTLADPSSSALLDMFDDAYPVTMDRYGHLIPEYMHGWAPRWAPTAIDWVSDFSSQPGTIIHGDFRTDNFMFGGGDEPVVIDWQLCSRAPGAYDLYYYLALSGDPAVVTENFDSLIGHYRAAYEAAGASPPGHETLLTQMRGVAMWLTCLGIVTFSQLDPANQRGEELFISMWDRGIQVAERLDLTPVLP